MIYICESKFNYLSFHKERNIEKQIYRKRKKEEIKGEK